jgi:NTE family protein
VKALGLAGALHGFAEHPTKPVTRWVSLAGSSAGGVIAAYLACGHGAADIERVLHETDFRRFEDFGPLGRVAGGAWNVLTRHSLVRGRYLEEWLRGLFGDRDFASVEGRLKLLAVDVTNRALLVLPDDLADEQGRPRWADPATGADIRPEALPLWRAVRMTVATPYVYPPVRLVLKETGHAATIVDGGTLSNFPVWLFDERRPVRPTYGFTLSGGHGVGGGLERLMHVLPWPASLGWDIAQTAMQAWDKRFVSHSTRVRTCIVPAGDVASTDFALAEAQKEALVESGRRAARDFLDAFDLAAYFNGFGDRLGSDRDASGTKP